jgi:hypothetical protein
MPTRTAARVAEAPHLSHDEQRLLAQAFAVAPALTRQQLQHWFAADSVATLCRRLRKFTDRGILVRERLGASRGAAPFAYALSRYGSRAVFGDTIHHGAGRLGRDVYHSLGIVDFYLRLGEAIHQINGEVLSWWGQSAALASLGNGRIYVNPDGAFLLGHRVEQLFLLEYDRAPNAAGATRFLEKLTRYRRYYEQRVYRDQFGLGNLRPVLLCLFDDAERMRRVRARARRLLTSTVTTLTVLFGDGNARTNPLATTWYELTAEASVSIVDDRFR